MRGFFIAGFFLFSTAMTKLYKKIEGELHYWECWAQGDGSMIAHWGKVGERGSNKIIDKQLGESEIDKFTRQGYVEFDDLEIATLVIEYAVDGMGTVNDLDKRQMIQERMDEALGWAGLGNCDGGSIGRGTMEIVCLVVDFAIARQVVERDLAGAGLADYARIYCEEEDRD
jgi:predicted DNA-binding WGR domain protein